MSNNTAKPYLFAPLLLILLVHSTTVTADVYITPWIGFTGGGKVVDEQDNEYDFKPSESFAVQIETPIKAGRIGLFYHYQGTEVESVASSVSAHYLHFQSAAYYPFKPKLNSYLGIGIGGGYTNARWVDDEFGLSASLFTGLEGEIGPNWYLNGQFRWLGTVVDSSSSAACNLPSGDTGDCIIRYKADWINQFSANLGVTFRF
ncbi:porin family protein [Vibrio sp. WXL103]|uniref:porin family protein n=1 Tax=unclassified Vibrio TaxID=2614977 RepID=UPI003EC4B82C